MGARYAIPILAGGLPFVHALPVTAVAGSGGAVARGVPAAGGGGRR